MEEEALLQLPEEKERKVVGKWKEFVGEMKKVGSIATPMVVVTVSQYLLQVVSMSMAGHLGEISLSSAAIATSPMLLASVSCTRVSNELGAGNPDAAQLAVWAVIALDAVEVTIASATLFCCRHILGRAFSNDKEVVDYVTDMAPLVCISIMMDSFQAVLISTFSPTHLFPFLFVRYLLRFPPQPIYFPFSFSVFFYVFPNPSQPILSLQFSSTFSPTHLFPSHFNFHPLSLSLWTVNYLSCEFMDVQNWRGGARKRVARIG